MADLNFVFLAEFAKVEANTTITAVGAGLKAILVPKGTPAVGLYLAGTVDRTPGEGEATLTVTIQPPDQSFSVSQSMMMAAADKTGDFALTAFSVSIQVPIAAAGKYSVQVRVDDVPPEEVALWVMISDDGGNDGRQE